MAAGRSRDGRARPQGICGRRRARSAVYVGSITSRPSCISYAFGPRPRGRPLDGHGRPPDGHRAPAGRPHAHGTGRGGICRRPWGVLRMAAGRPRGDRKMAAGRSQDRGRTCCLPTVAAGSWQPRGVRRMAARGAGPGGIRICWRPRAGVMPRGALLATVRVCVSGALPGRPRGVRMMAACGRGESADGHGAPGGVNGMAAGRARLCGAAAGRPQDGRGRPQDCEGRRASTGWPRAAPAVGESVDGRVAPADAPRLSRSCRGCGAAAGASAGWPRGNLQDGRRAAILPRGVRV